MAGAIAVMLPFAAAAYDTETTQAVLDNHLAAFGTADMERILSDYTDESIIFFNGLRMKGPAEIEPLFQALFDEFGKPGMTFEMLNVQVDGPVAYIVWTAETADNVYEVASDTLVIDDGKIAYQTIAGKITPK